MTRLPQVFTLTYRLECHWIFIAKPRGVPCRMYPSYKTSKSALASSRIASRLSETGTRSGLPG